jgi:asparagine synthase (glutamine-hydrolysing)
MALRAAGLAHDHLDETALADYLVVGHVLATSTPVGGVRALPPGTFIVWSGVGAVPSAPIRWWNLPRPVSADRLGEGDEVERFRVALRDSAERHARADRPVGVFLSGGVDSTVLSSLATAAGGSIGTLTVTWPEVGGDESVAAEDVARRLGVDHHEIPYSGTDLIDVLPKAIESMDVPTSDGLNTWIVCSAARSAGFVVVLSGLGADELFGGYPTFRQVPRVARASEAIALIPEGLRVRLAKRAAQARPGGRMARMLSSERGLPGAYACVRSLFSPQELTQHGVSLPFGPYVAAGAVSQDRTDTVGWLELENYLPDQLLRDADQMSMAHSLELRVPYLDDDVVAAALAIPVRARLGVLGSKQVLRDTVALPSQPKRPFTLPLDSWLSGILKPWIRESLLSDALPLSTELPSKFRHDLLVAFDERRTHWSRPWAVAILRRWIEARDLGP